MPEALEAKGWGGACEEGGEDGILGMEIRAAFGKKGPVFLPLRGSDG